jgi:hypothetical protein
MATALFIKPETLKRNTIIDGNVDVDLFIHFVKIAQQIHIRNYLGTDLYNKISADIIANSLSGAYLTLVNTHIQPMLIHYAMCDYLPHANYKIKQGGVFKHSSETAQIATKEEVDYLVAKQREYAEYYTTRFIDFMAFNQSSYPEYTSNTNDDIHPDRDSLFNGWVL